jgi:hypothetical protein
MSAEEQHNRPNSDRVVSLHPGTVLGFVLRLTVKQLTLLF